jgi:IS1 family transposase
VGDNPKKIVPRMKDYEDDGPWMWVAFVPGCRLILDFVIGPRKQYVTDKLVELVNKHLSDKIPVFVTDGLNFYREALLKQFGVLREFPRTGKRGRPKKPKIVPSDDLRYAQVVKTRKNGVLEKVEKKIIFGEDIEQSEISTTLLERQNLTFRQDNNRVSRKTIGFSKVKEWLENQMKLYCTHFSATRRYVMNCVKAALSIWGNPTRMCINSNVGVQSFWNNVKISENPIRKIC